MKKYNISQKSGERKDFNKCIRMLREILRKETATFTIIIIIMKNVFFCFAFLRKSQNTKSQEVYTKNQKWKPN